LWRNSLDTTVTRYSSADGDGSGVIDQADYNRWRTNFSGGALGVGTAVNVADVPEPPIASLAVFCLAILMTARKMKRRGSFNPEPTATGYNVSPRRWLGVKRPVGHALRNGR